MPPVSVSPSINPPKPVFFGYRFKIPWIPDRAWKQKCGPVDDVCSVGDCLATPPDDWVDRWDFNRASCYSTPEVARATLPVDGAAAYKLFAYSFIPLKFSVEHGPVPVSTDEAFPDELPAITSKEDASRLRMLGYDVVALEGATFLGYGCSPLSCNYMAEEIPVNRHCLIDDLDLALKAAQRFQNEQPEPGDYYVIQVLEVEDS